MCQVCQETFELIVNLVGMRMFSSRTGNKKSFYDVCVYITMEICNKNTT